MKEKIEFLLRNKGLSSTQLARILEIQPSGISHILSGRNKPSFDLVVKILRAFPDINPDWLLLDSDETFRAEPALVSSSAKSDHRGNASLFDEHENIEISKGLTDEKNDTATIFSNSNKGSKPIKRIIVLYADNTFESFLEL